MDANKDGTIDMEEWEKFMTEELQAAFDLDTLLNAMDTDANGSISIEEFKNGLPKEVLQTMSSKLNEKGLIEGI